MLKNELKINWHFKVISWIAFYFVAVMMYKKFIQDNIFKTNCIT